MIPRWLGKIGVYVAILVVGFVCGLTLRTRNSSSPSQSSLPSVSLGKGSEVLSRNPSQPPPAVKHLPKGAKVLQETRIEVKPDPTPLNPHPQPVQITLATIETPQGARVVAETPNGDISGDSWTMGPPPKVYHWNAQAVRMWTQHGATWGGSVGWEKGPVLASVTVFPGQIQAGVGFRW